MPPRPATWRCRRLHPAAWAAAGPRSGTRRPAGSGGVAPPLCWRSSTSAATSSCTEAYRLALECEKAETTFAQLAESGGFIRLDALLPTALMECIPGCTHLLRQEIKKAKAEQRTNHQRNITGRQVFMMIHRFFAMNDKDKHMTDTARLHKITLQNGDIQQLIDRLD